MAVERGSNFSNKGKREVAGDFIVYPSGCYRRILPGGEPRSLNRPSTINPQELEDDDFVIPRGTETPLMSRVRKANNEKAIEGVLRRAFTDTTEVQTLRGAEEILGVSDSTLHSWLNKFNIARRPKDAPKTRSKIVTSLASHAREEETVRDTLVRLYRTHSLRGIADVLGVSHSAVRERLIDFEIPLRHPHKNRHK